MQRKIMVISLFSLILALVLLFDLAPFLRGDFGWQWPYRPVPLGRVLPLIVTAIVYLMGAWWLLGRARGLLLWSFLGAVTLSAVALLARSDGILYELFIRTASGSTTGQHLAGATIDWTNWLHWPQTVAPFAGRSGHIVLSGPLLPLWYGGLNAALDSVPALARLLQSPLIAYQCRNYDLLTYSPAQWASAWFGILMPVWAALAVFPLYVITKRLVDKKSARLVVGWWPLVPALVLFAPTWNTVYPFLALIAFWFLLRGLDANRGAGWLVAAGCVSSLLTFANFSLVPLLGFFGFYTLFHTLRSAGRRWSQPVLVGVWFGIGLIAPWLVYWLASGLTPLDLLTFAMANHLILDRPYLPWVWLHFQEWALMIGIPLIVLWLLAALRPEKRDSLSLALAVTMLVLLISGTARGETGRVWLFFAPFVFIGAGQWLKGETINVSLSWLAIGISQAALLVALVMSWDVVNAPDMLPPPAPPGSVSVSADRQVNAVFGESVNMVGWDAQIDGDSVIVSLNWQAQKRVATPYWFAGLLVAPDGSLPQQPVVWQAVDTRYPTTCWRPGEIVGDVIHLPLPDGAQAGDWWISLSVFGDKSDPEDRLPVRLPDGTIDNQIGLGPVRVG